MSFKSLKSYLRFRSGLTIPDREIYHSLYCGVKISKDTVGAQFANALMVI